MHQQRLRLRLFDQRNDFAQILFDVVRRKAAQPVIAAKFDQHPARLMLLQQRRKTRQPLAGGVAADAGVNDFYAVRPRLPFLIQQGGPGAGGRHAIARAEAIAQYQ